MNNSQKGFLRELAYFQNNSYTYTDKVLDEQAETTLHPSNFIIHSGYSEYIPMCHLYSDMFSVNIEDGTLEDEFIIPLMYHPTGDSQRIYIRSVQAPERFSSGIQMRTATHSSSYYFNKGLVMNDEEILFCAAIKTDFLKKLFIDIHSQFKDNRLFKLLIDNELHNSPEAKELREVRVMDALGDIDLEAVNDNMVVFCNERKMKTMCTFHIDNYNRAFGRNSTWGEFRYIQDDIGEWFNSKVFVQPELPSFQDIDGPENYLMEQLQKETEQSEEDIDGAYVEVNPEGYSANWDVADTGSATTLNI